jgi:hypothetical protein
MPRAFWGVKFERLDVSISYSVNFLNSSLQTTEYAACDRFAGFYR